MTPPSSSAGSRWEIVPLQVGLCLLGERHLLGDDHSDDDRVEFALQSFLLRRGPDGPLILVDLGPKTVGFLNDMFRRYGFFRGEPGGAPGPDDIRQPKGNILDRLQALGIRPGQVDHIVFTHLHADHHGMDTPGAVGAPADFPRAVFHVSAAGWADNVSKRTGGGWGSYVDHTFSDFLLRALEEGRAIASDNTEIAPGVRTLYLGGHSLCSQAVLVETASGTAVITSDEVYRYDLLARGVLARLHVTPERWRRAVAKLADLAVENGAILLPVHEPLLEKIYGEEGPDRWLERAGRIGREAAESYRSAVGGGGEGS